MTEILRRSFVKGLFLAAASPILIGKPVLASTNLAEAVIHEYKPTAHIQDSVITRGRLIPIESLKIELIQPLSPVISGDPDTLGCFLYNFVHNRLDYVNGLAFEPNDAYTRNIMKENVKQELESRVLNGTLYHYSVIMDERNNSPDMIERNAKSLDVYLRPSFSTAIYGLRFGYDPLLT